MDDITNKNESSSGVSPRIFTNITQHFAFISTVIGLTAILSSTVFLYGYLSVFDSHLIWVIEYSHVLKFGLVIFAVISGLLYFVKGYAEDAYDLITADPIKRAWWIKFLILAFAANFIPRILADETSSEHYYMLHITTHASALMIGFLVIATVWRARTWQTVKPRQILDDIALIVVALSLFGRTFGYYTRDMGEFKNDVVLKGVEIMHDVGVVMIISHHTVLYTSTGDVIVVPSADVSKIIRKAEAK